MIVSIKKKKRTINIIVDELGMNFQKSKEENMNLLARGYIVTEEHFNNLEHAD